MKKGFVFTASVILIVLILVLFASFYAQKNAESERQILKTSAILKAGFAADDVESDLNELLGLKTSITRNNPVTIITINDSLPSSLHFSNFSEWSSFVSGNYATQQNASIVINASALADGKAELLFSNGLEYDHQYSNDQNYVKFFNPSGSTNAVTFDVNLVISGAQYDSENSNAWVCPHGGDVNVRLNLKDAFGSTIESECQMHAHQEYEYEIAFVGKNGNVKVKFGSIDGNNGSLKIENNLEDSDVNVNIILRTELPKSINPIKAYYNVDLNYAQADVNINKLLEVAEN